MNGMANELYWKASFCVAGRGLGQTKGRAHANQDDPHKYDHFILVVTNCGLSAHFDDERRFNIKALAI
jgi:hypothetical protein